MDTLKNIDENIVNIGNEQKSEFQAIKNKLDTIERNQDSLNKNLQLIFNQLNTVIEDLEKTSRK
jgi:GTP-binding protein EngB required for normal cell division|tara:strand:- start:146 stop:337 length:192 start_codon:yes stop_codon:yes gene_type:complete